MEPLDQTVSRLRDRPRFLTALLAFFAGTGLLLAIVGLYSLIAFMTTQRRHEIGVRMALGATRGNILGLITSDGLRMVAIGGALGRGSALAVSKMLKALRPTNVYCRTSAAHAGSAAGDSHARTGGNARGSGSDAAE
jgi:ABC-type antimicrobial peptide transport system permease subunit